MLANKYTQKNKLKVTLKGSDDHGLGEEGKGEGGPFTNKFKDQLQSHSSSCCILPPSLYSSAICTEKKYGHTRRGTSTLL